MNKKEIKNICKKYKIKNYTINADGTIDVDGDVVLRGYKLNKLPLKFNRVSGYFSCMLNKLTSLEGSPNYVGGYFSASFNYNLTSLEGLGEVVGKILVDNIDVNAYLRSKKISKVLS